MRHIFIRLIKLYQKFISPIKPPTCRFYPTCSTYSLESYKRFGALKGTFLTVIRLAKCHPFHPGGIDLVPEKKPKKGDKVNIEFHTKMKGELR